MGRKACGLALIGVVLFVAAMGAELLDAADVTRAWGAALIEENAEMAGAGLLLLALCATLEERLAGPLSALRASSR